MTSLYQPFCMLAAHSKGITWLYRTKLIRDCCIKLNIIARLTLGTVFRKKGFRIYCWRRQQQVAAEQGGQARRKIPRLTGGESWDSGEESRWGPAVGEENKANGHIRTLCTSLEPNIRLLHAAIIRSITDCFCGGISKTAGQVWINREVK